MASPIKDLETIGSSVSWFPKAEHWRIEISGSPTLQAVFMKHARLVQIAEIDTHDPEVVAGLVQIHRGAIEDSIEIAASEGWPDRLGLIPQRVPEA